MTTHGVGGSSNGSRRRLDRVRSLGVSRPLLPSPFRPGDCCEPFALQSLLPHRANRKLIYIMLSTCEECKHTRKSFEGVHCFKHRLLDSSNAPSFPHHLDENDFGTFHCFISWSGPNRRGDLGIHCPIVLWYKVRHDQLSNHTSWIEYVWHMQKYLPWGQADSLHEGSMCQSALNNWVLIFLG